MSIVCGHKWFVLSLLLLFAVACTENGEGENGDPNNEDPSVQCERGDNNTPEDAASLSIGEVTTGYICPVGHQEWYSFSLEAAEPIIDISAGMSTGLTPVELTYSIYEDQGGDSGEVVARANLDEIGMPQPLQALECLEPGDYLVALRDYTENNQDFNHHYELEIDTRANPDGNEPNNTAEEATQVQDGDTTQGYIACRGDEDWYSIDLDDRELLHLQLEADPLQYQIEAEVHSDDGEVLATVENASSQTEATEIERLVAVQGAGTYFVVVRDMDDVDADLETPYELTLDIIEDIDPNEPNDTPEQATDLSESAVSCGSGWSETLSTWGTISAPGDIDWFRIPIEGCENGLLEAEMVFDTDDLSNEEKWDLSHELQANLMMVRPHHESPCEADDDCEFLELPCADELDCAGYNEQCNPSTNTCAAPRSCLQEGVCGGNQVQRRYDCPDFLPECVASPDTRPDRNRAVISAPIFGGDAIYLRASDFQSQAAQPQLRYDLEVRIRDNPDTNEPNNLFTNEVESSLPISENQAFATTVDVLDCTGDEPECCGSGDWITGSVGYQNDMDWFRYEHPCPEEDCTIAFHYEIDAGPVDYVMNLHNRTSLWHTLVFSDYEDSHPARSMTLGGLDPGNECLYSSQHHDDDDYYILVRDRLELLEDGRTVNEDTRAWDPDQQYRFCIEKVSDICEEPPCVINENDQTCDMP